MSSSRVVVTLTEAERQALVDLSRREYRFPSDQARYLLRRALEAYGLLSPAQLIEQQPAKASPEVHDEHPV